MSPATAVGSLYARSSGTWVLAAYCLIFTGGMVAVTRAYASVLEASQREALVVIGLTFGMLWVPGLVGFMARKQLADARVRLLPNASVHVIVAIAILIAGYATPALTVAVLMHGDAIASAGLLGLIGACIWRLGWSEKRSLAFVLLAAAIILPPVRDVLARCLHGEDPSGSLALLSLSFAAIAIAVMTSIHDLRSDRLGLEAPMHWTARISRRLRWSPRPAAWTPVDATARSWARHLARGWRAEGASPLALVLIAFVGSSCVPLIAAHEHWTPADLSEASLIGIGIVSLQWLSLLGASGGSAARADAARPVGRARFAALVLLVSARLMVRSWACLWAGAFAGLSVGLCIWPATASLPQALTCCGQHLALLPALIAYFAWMLSVRGRGEMVAMLVITQILLMVAVLPMMHGSAWWLTITPAVAAIEFTIGIMACWIVYWRWRTLEIR